MNLKKYKYSIVCVSPAGETLINSFVRLKDAKKYVDLFPHVKHYIVPRHDVLYYIEYYKHTFIKHDRRLY